MPKVRLLFVSLLLMAAAVAGCSQPAAPEEKAPPGGDKMPFMITSPAFMDGAQIPVKYTCDGQNISPVLEWADSPAGTTSFAMTLDDPDAPVRAFTHWVVYNLPAGSRSLPEAVSRGAELTTGGLQGKNGAGIIGYMGPCPPKGSPHHYNFTLYALDKSLDTGAGATKDQVLQAMEGRILGQARLIGIYQR